MFYIFTPIWEMIQLYFKMDSKRFQPPTSQTLQEQRGNYTLLAESVQVGSHEHLTRQIFPQMVV